MPQYYRIAVATPLRRTFVYLPPDQADLPKDPVGCRVQVPFGYQKLVGIVVAVEDSQPEDVNPEKLKKIDDDLKKPLKHIRTSSNELDF